jgi:acetylornithine/succinyldiaminopimelate/putrescine aminotransferase
MRPINVHLSGGPYNLEHRIPELVEAITIGMRSFDIGHHHFPSSARAALAEALVHTAPPNLTKVVYGSGQGEAIDIAFKTARHATKRCKIVSIRKAHHGHTGLAVATGTTVPPSCSSSTPTISRKSGSTTSVPWRWRWPGSDVAAVIMETIPASYGFPLPEPGYLEAAMALCERHGSLYIADEVQTGLMRTDGMWAMPRRSRRWCRCGNCSCSPGSARTASPTRPASSAQRSPRERATLPNTACSPPRDARA